jgi:hypothetical protein
MKYYFIFLLFFATAATAQTIVKKHPVYDLQKDASWIDSVKHCIKKGYPENQTFKNYFSRQLAFVKNCVLLGLYYERMFDNKKLPNMRLALKYYFKVDDMPYFPDDERCFRASAIKANLRRRVSDIYFKGKGVKKDLRSSYYYAINGIGRNSLLVNFYTKRFFGEKYFALGAKWAYKNDSTYQLMINPFLERSYRFYLKKNDKDVLGHIANMFISKYNTDSFYIIKMVTYSENSMRSQANAYRVLERVSDFLIKKYHVDPNMIYTDVIIGEESLTYMYKDFKIPLIRIFITKN